MPETIAPVATPSTPLLVPTPAVPTEGAAKAGFYGALEKKAGLQPETKTAPEKKVESKAKLGKTEAPDVPTSDKLPEPADKTGKSSDVTSSKEQPKANPWKLVEEYKTKLATSESELAKSKREAPDAVQLKQLQTQVEQLSKSNREMEDELRFANYKKHPEFQDKYEKPYQEQWKRAMSNLSEIPVTEADGSTRALTPRDIEEIVNLPLVEAKDRARDKFGDFANDVIAERKEIRRLWQAQSEALDKARAEAGQRDKQQVENWQKQNGELRQELAQEWQTANDAAQKHEKYGKYFTPTEGDDEGNAVLEKGYKLVDDALSVNPGDPRLNKEQRIQAVKRSAAVRNRAAAFSRLLLQAQRDSKRISELEAELKEFETTVPNVDGKTSGSGAPAKASARQQFEQALEKRSRPSF